MLDEQTRENTREWLIGLIDEALASDHLVIGAPVEVRDVTPPEATSVQRELGPLQQLTLAWWKGEQP
jgi:hypothetical protein